MMCKILTIIYGRDTRPAQCLNITMTMLWAVICMGAHGDWLAVYLPATVSASVTQIVWLLCFTLLFSLSGFITEGRVRQVTKAFGLALGGLANIIIANSYATAYPPLDPILLLCVVLGLWFLGAVFFILQCEGINGASRTKP